MSSPARPCRPHLVDAGFPNRTPLILTREAGLFASMTDQLLRPATRGRVSSTAEPGIEPVAGKATTEAATGAARQATIDTVVDALGEPKGPHLVAAAFLAGHCEIDEPADAGRLRDALLLLLDAYDPAKPSAASVAHAYAGLSLALLGEADTAIARLRPLVDVEGPRSMGDPLAAFHLAQLGDPSGYPLIVRLVGAKEGFTRLMAARHVAAFLPYAGQSVAGEAVVVVDLLATLLDDKDELVSVEIPGLLAEADPVDARPILERAAKKARHKPTRRAAADVLTHLT